MAKTVNNIHKFKKKQLKSSFDSAKRILPWLLDQLQPRSILDVGCGIGCWLKICNKNGIKIKGIEHPSLEKVVLREIEPFVDFYDLEVNFPNIEKYDVCLCLEVAEHLPEFHADKLVSFLVSSSDAILFSAAIPNRVSEQTPLPFSGFHKNEQWQSYWIYKFRQYEYQPYEIRHLFWDDDSVAHWYKQSIFLFMKNNPQLNVAKIYNLVHPHQYLTKLESLEKFQNQSR